MIIIRDESMQGVDMDGIPGEDITFYGTRVIYFEILSHAVCSKNIVMILRVNVGSIWPICPLINLSMGMPVGK